MRRSACCLYVVVGLLLVNAAAAQTNVQRDALGKVVAVTAATTAGASSMAVPAAEASYDYVALARGQISRYGAPFGLSDPNTELAPKLVDNDSLGMTHVRFQQVYKKVPVYGGEMIVHMNGSLGLKSINGNFVRSLSLNTAPAVSQNEAKTRAAKLFSKKFSVTAQVGEVKLWVLDGSLLPIKGPAGRLAWEVKISNPGARLSESFFVDARSGELVYQLSHVKRLTMNREVWDYIIGEWTYLLNFFDSRYNYTFGRSEGQAARGRNPSTGGNPDLAYDRLRQVHFYYLRTFNRNGANGQGGLGDGINVPYDKTKFLCDEACPGGAYADGYVSMCSSGGLIDLLGHEYTHAVNESNDLIYSGQPGTLEEARAEMGGEGFHWYLRGVNDWKSMAEEAGGPWLNFADPHTGTSHPARPDRWYDPLFYCGGDDNGGIHRNVTVPMKANYLMSQGGVFNGCTIRPINIDRTQQIWYRAALQYFIPNTTFNAARIYFLQACADLYAPGICYQVDKALRAVEMDQAGLCSGIPRVDPVCDLCPEDPNKTDPGCNGCGVADTDSDGDGAPDCWDSCPADATKTSPQRCGCNVTEIAYDADRDGYFGVSTTATSCPALVQDCNDANSKIRPDAVEICDAKDNNCDGNTDEGFNIGATCTVGTGACQATGQIVCNGTTATKCNAVLPPSSIAGRYVFYNNSSFDSATDDAALAANKMVLLPGQTATFANYTSYSRGINGVMVDFNCAANSAALTAADFEIKVGNSNNLTDYVDGPAPTVTVRAGAGTNGADRVVLTWANNAVPNNKWLRVKVLSTSNTGLSTPDVFYFGNAIGETGNNAGSAVVDAADETLVTANFTGFTPAAIDNRYDFNRDRKVNATDQIIARTNASGGAPLLLITAP